MYVRHCCFKTYAGPGSGFTVDDFVDELFDSSVFAVVEAQYIGDCEASGRVFLPTDHVIYGAFGLAPAESFALVLTSGLLAVAAFTRNDLRSSRDIGTPGIPGRPGTNDAARVEVIVEALTTIDVSFTYVFASEEYNEGVNFDDIFVLLIGQADTIDPDDVTGLVNVAIVPGTANTPVSTTTINLGSNSQFYRNNDPNNSNTPFATAYDGLTTVLQTESFAFAAGTKYRISVNIADGLALGPPPDEFPVGSDSAVYLMPAQ